MSNDVLDQLHSIRESVADALRKDPRYLTISALDKSIDEIAAVLAAFEPPPAASAEVK